MAVEKELSELDVNSVKVDIGSVEVDFDSEKLSEEMIINAISEAGYKVVISEHQNR
jgi:copper chaperone CopZ